MASFNSDWTKEKTIFSQDFSFLKEAEFKNNMNTIKTKIYTVRLNRIKSLKDRIKSEFGLTRLNDLIHCITGLYDISLPDIGIESIYDCICSSKAYTILVVKQAEQVELEQSDSIYTSQDCLNSLENEIEEPVRIFEDLFSEEEKKESEDENEENDDDDNDDEENKEGDNTKGLRSFLALNKSKRFNIVKNLIACATLERVSTFQLPGQDEWLIDLQLMSVREKYRGYSIGKCLIDLIQNRNIVGNYDAIVTCSDSDAIKFYEKYAFSIDPILNSKYTHIGDLWTNTTKMCYIPPYCSLNEQLIKPKPLIDNNDDLQLEEIDLANENSFIQDLTNMERDVKRWQKLMFSSYQFQAKLFFKLKQEILNLKASLLAKENLIQDLKLENEVLVKKNTFLKLKFQDLNLNENL